MLPLKEITNTRILYSFLNWGKGHLSRSIGICKQLVQQGNRLVVACEKEDFLVLAEYLDNLEFVELANYPFHFSGKGNFAVDLWKSRKALLQHLQNEQVIVENLVKEYQIDVVLSDHRYGFYSKHVSSVFITHQVNLALKWWQFPAQMIHNRWMQAFSWIWILDDDAQSLAGKLSTSNRWANSSYIGHFSRFDATTIDTPKKLVIGVCNGPFPYNFQLLQQLEAIKHLDYIITSLPCKDKRAIQPRSWKETDALFYQAKTIYSYCGYTTLMDIKALGCEGNLYPTPGQSEQVYLHQLHKSKIERQ